MGKHHKDNQESNLKISIGIYNFLKFIKMENHEYVNEGKLKQYHICHN